MLYVESESGWTPLSPQALTDSVVGGRLDHATPARDERGTGMLEEVIDAEAIGTVCQRLLGEVWAVYQGKVPSLGLGALEVRVTELARWNLAPGNRPARLRLAWLAAWLAELLDKVVQAVRRYE